MIEAPQTGSPTPMAPLSPLAPGSFPWNLSVWINNGTARLESNFMGLTPGATGVYQVNFKMPESLPAGDLLISLERSRNCGFFFVQGCGRGIVREVSKSAKLAR